MQFPRECKVWKVCASKQSRFAMEFVRFEQKAPGIDGPGLIATNGHALVIVGVDEAGEDTSGFVTPEALKAAGKPDSRGRPATLICNGDLRAPLKGQSFERPKESEHTFPQVSSVIPAEGREGAVRIGLNAHLLSELADALGSESGKVFLEFVRDERGLVVAPIRVTTPESHCPARLAVLMPAMVDA